MKNITLIGFLLIYGKVSIAQPMSPQKWTGMNDPYRLGKDYTGVFNQLPTKGFLAETLTAWPGSYWPNNKGGIAYRWSSENPRNFVYSPPRREVLGQLSQSEINELSPAEKFDIYNGDYTYSTVKKVWSQTSPNNQSWYGICHGVAPASIHHKEPETVERINHDGIKIKFYSSDVKALLAYYYGKVADQSAIQVGSRCYLSWFFGRFIRHCQDIDAGAFHIVLANKVGLLGKTFIADIMRYKIVSNHPVVSYKSSTINRFQITDPLRLQRIEQIEVVTDVTFAASISPYKDPVINTENAVYYHEKYHYYLNLNESGEIISGNWISNKRPDFIWYKNKSEFQGKWKLLSQIYQPRT